MIALRHATYAQYSAARISHPIQSHYIASFNKMLNVSLWAKIMQNHIHVSPNDVKKRPKSEPKKGTTTGTSPAHLNCVPSNSAKHPSVRKDRRTGAWTDAYIPVNDDLQAQLINFDIMMTYRLWGDILNVVDMVGGHMCVSFFCCFGLCSCTTLSRKMNGKQNIDKDSLLWCVIIRCKGYEYHQQMPRVTCNAQWSPNCGSSWSLFCSHKYGKSMDWTWHSAYTTIGTGVIG